MKLVFLNQSAGVLFRELAEDCARALGGGTLITGMRETLAAPRIPELSVLPAPPYDRRNLAARAKSWLAYFFSAAAQTLFAPGRQFAFIVSNPPFLGMLGVALRLLRGDRYAVLVYDLYPDLLENYGKVPAGGMVATLWRWFNRITWERADAVFTLGRDMAERMRRGFDPRRTRLREIVIVPPWADANALVPVDPSNNPFRKAHARPDQTVVLYSGNFGITHDLETITAAARSLSDRKHLKFLFIGSGAKQPVVDAYVRSVSSDVAELLPPVPEGEMRWSITSGDMALATLEPEAAGCSFPSKTFTYLAAGVPVVVLAPRDTDLARLVDEHDCGVVCPPGDAQELARSIEALAADQTRLARMKANARRAAVERYGRNLSAHFAKALRTCMGRAGR